MKNNFPKTSFFLSILIFIISVIAFWFLFRIINNNNLAVLVKEQEWQQEFDRRNEIRALDNSIKVVSKYS